MNNPPEPLRIFGWAADHNGCGYYRIGVPLHGLQQRGHLIYASQLLEAHAEIADVIIGQRVATPETSHTWQLLARGGKRLVYEVDDDVFNIDPSSAWAFHHFGRRDIQDLIRRNLEVSAMVTVTTERLAKVMREYNDNVVVIPNFIDEAVFDIDEPSDGPATIGWSGSTTHQMDFREAGRFLKKLAKRRPDVKFHFAGADYGTEMFDEDRYRFSPWRQEVMEHYRTVKTFGIGLAPLARHRFNESKSYIKALEYHALGIPCIVSNELPYRDYIEHGVDGFLVRDGYDWLKYATKLIDDPELYETFRTNGLKKAKANTIQGNAHLWESALRKVAEGA